MTDHPDDPGPPGTHDVVIDGSDPDPANLGTPDAGPGPSGEEPSQTLVGEVVVRGPAGATAAQPRLARGIALARERYVALSANPAVVTAVTVGAGIAAGLLRHALASGSRRRPGASRTLTVSGLVLHRVDVVHHHFIHQHVFHYAAARPILPPGGPSPR